MTMPKADLSEYVLVDTSPARADRLWSRVQERLEEVRPSRRWTLRQPAWVMAALLAAFGGGWLVAHRPAESGWAQLETHEGAAQVQLQDGSRLTLDRDTRLGVREQAAQRVELALELGRVECDVTHDPGRVFSVTAAGYDVRVKGTRFSVDLSRERNQLAVVVQSGTVEVHRALQPTAEATLRAGERWSVPLEGSTARDEPAPAVATPPSGSDRPALRHEPVDAGHAALPPAAPRPAALPPAALPPVDETARSSPVPERSTPPAPRAPSDQHARALFDRANAARRQGDLGRATRAYEQLVRQHPDDARAGLAALELGRLRMDEFQDAAGAVTALQLAVARASDPGLRADALARLVRAYEILKDRDGCQRARADYLQDYPTGAHVLSVARACGVK